MLIPQPTSTLETQTWSLPSTEKNIFDGLPWPSVPPQGQTTSGYAASVTMAVSSGCKCSNETNVTAENQSDQGID